MKNYSRFFLVFLAAGFITACGAKKENAVTQVAAKVDGQEISVHQINYTVARVGNIPQDKQQEAGKQALRELVDQQLLVNQALQKRLDHTPDVLQTIEAAKRQILAQAYMDELAQQLVKPTDAEIHEYYVKTPDLFSNRRIYKFAEISVGGATQVEQIKQWLSGQKNLDGFVARLRKENIGFRTSSVVKAAEELPLDMLPKFFKMAKGEVAIIPLGGTLTVLQLQDYREQPLTEQQAKPAITNFLFAQKRSMLAEAETKKLKDSAKIEYLGSYADMGKIQPAAAPVLATPAAPQKNDLLEKGLSGLN